VSFVDYDNSLYFFMSDRHYEINDRPHEFRLLSAVNTALLADYSHPQACTEAIYHAAAGFPENVHCFNGTVRKLPQPVSGAEDLF